MTERTAIRLGIPTLLVVSVASATAVSVQTAAAEVPTFAFNSRAVLAVQLALLFFYASLLLLVPLVRALSDGELPIELSLKGVRWSENFDDVAERQTIGEKDSLTEIREMQREIEAVKRTFEEVTFYDEHHGNE
jgi:hypothetical protein